MAVSGPRRKMWGVEMAVVVLGLLAVAVQPSMQRSSTDPLRGVVHKINQAPIPLGIIATSTNSEKAFNESGIFNFQYGFEYFGRKFMVGTILGSRVIFVNTVSRPMVHVGITVDILARDFNVGGIIHFGTAGSVNNSLSIGTVVAPGLVAHTGVWTWQKSPAAVLPIKKVLDVAKYNYPPSENAQNTLGIVVFEQSEVYVDGKLKESLWLPAHHRYLRAASRIKTVGEAEVVVGVRGASSDIYVNNNAYREFLGYNFEAAIVDTTSAAVALAAKTFDLPYISLRGVSNTAGASDEHDSALANANAVLALESLVFQLTVPRADE